LNTAGDFGDTSFQGTLVHQMRYMASVVSNSLSAFGDLLNLPKRLIELDGGLLRVSELLDSVDKAAAFRSTSAEGGWMNASN
jgi:hypothetical protein